MQKKRQMGDRIREARLDADLTQDDLAEMIGVHKQAVHRWETGKTDIRLRNLEALASNLDVEIMWLIAGVE